MCYLCIVHLKVTKRMSVMRKVVVVVMMIVSAGVAKANVQGDSTVFASNQFELSSFIGGDNSLTTDNSFTEKEIHVSSAVSAGKRMINVITGTNDAQVDVMVVSLEGDVVYEGKVKGYTSTIELGNDVEPGMYMVQLSTGNIQKTKQLIVR